MSRIDKNEYLNYTWSDLGEVICHLEDAGCDDLVEAILAQDGDKAKLKCRANEATIILRTAMICDTRGIDEAMKYYNGTHSEDEYQEYRTSVMLPN